MSKVPSSARTDDTPNEKPLIPHALLVVGMHRSGTSAVTRVLSLLGAALPSRLMPPKAHDNTPGYWESQDIADIHDDLLDSLGSAWDDVSLLPENWQTSDTARRYQDQLQAVLERDFRSTPLFVLKDPRLCRLLPMWIDMLPHFRARTDFVLPIRNPLEVAASLQARSALPLARSLLLWLVHVVAAERYTRTHTRSIFEYSDLLRTPETIVCTIAKDLALTWPRHTFRAKSEISAFLSSRHRHHVFTADDLEAHPDVPAPVKETYRALLTLRTGTDPEAVRALDDVWHQLRRADALFGPVVAHLRHRLDFAQHELARLNDGGSDARTDRPPPASLQNDTSPAPGPADQVRLERLTQEFRDDIRWLSRDLAILRNAGDQVRQDLQDLRSRVTQQARDLEDELARSRTENDDLRQRLELEARHSSLATVAAHQHQRGLRRQQAQFQQATALLQLSQQAVRTLEESLRETHVQLAYVNSSASWRLTRPLRAFLSATRRSRHRSESS